MSTIQYLDTPRGYHIAYRHQPGEGVGVIFLSGYRSDMASTKAAALSEFCAKNNIPFTCFDYFAHGASGGEFIDYTIGAALADTLDILDQVAAEEVVAVGSSMGGWLGMLAALERPRQVRALVGVAAAPDFTERFMEKKFTPAMRETMERDGVLYVHSDFYDNDYPVSMHFISEARRHLVLEHPIPLSIPIHLLQGQLDEDVPWETALLIAEKLTGDEVTVTFVKDGDHRLNRPQDLQLLLEAVARMQSK